MTTLWVHCGMLKTATSHIQNTAWRASAQLLSQGWLYPQAGLVTDEPEVGVRHAKLVHLIHEPVAWRSEVDHLIEEISESGASQVLLSAESWAKPVFLPAIRQLIAALTEAQVISDIRAVVYVRNRVDHARGVYREMTRRRGNQSDFQNFVANRKPMFDPLLVIRGLQDVFGEHVSVRNYDRVSDVAQDFFSYLGADLTQAPERTNVGWDAVRVAAQRHMSRFARGLQAPESATLLPGQPAGLYGEWVRPDILTTADQNWRTEFADRSGWSTTEIDELIGPGKVYLRDVAEADRIISAAVEDWLLRRRVPSLNVTALAGAVPGAVHWDAQAGFSDPNDFSRVSIKGRALLREPFARMLWIPSEDGSASEPVELATGLPSPGLASRHATHPQAAAARFEGEHLVLRPGAQASLVAETTTGETIGLAHVSARSRV
jgi:hypothetical protein